MLVACLDVGCLVIGAGAGYGYATRPKPDAADPQAVLGMRLQLEQCRAAQPAQVQKWYVVDNSDQCCVNLARVNRRYE
jgi:hypothetical protein